MRTRNSNPAAATTELVSIVSSNASQFHDLKQDYERTTIMMMNSVDLTLGKSHIYFHCPSPPLSTYKSL